MASDLAVHDREPLRREVRQVQPGAMAVFGIIIVCMGVAGAVGASSLSVVVGLVLGGPIVFFGLVFTVMALLANRQVRRRHRKRLAALDEALGQAPALVPIGDAQGRCRIRGRVRVLAFASDADPDVAARAVREVTKTEDDVAGSREGKVEMTAIDELRSCGRFAITDDSGVAIIDPDDFEVVARDSADPFDPMVVTAKQDDLIEIIGTARRVPATQLDDLGDLLGPAGYREAGRKVALFDGAKDPVLIVAPRH